MPVRSDRSRWRHALEGSAVPAVAVLVSLLAAANTAAQRVEKPVQDWLKQYRLLVTAEEQKVLPQLKAADVEAFATIFWARRNPAPETGANPYRAAIEKARADADARFGDVGHRGSETACGQALMLLGNPDEVQGRELRNIFDTRPSSDSRYRRPEPTTSNATRDGARRPELWTYKSNTTRVFRMPGGDLKLQFDDGCEFDEGARTIDELARLAAERVVHPEIRYEFGADGRLRPTVAVPRAAAPAPAVSPVRALADRPRADFAAVFETKIQVPGQGGAYTAGILRGGAGALPVPTGGAPVRLRALARSAPAAGPAIDTPETDVFAAVGPDGSFVTSYGFTLAPGRYRVSLAVLDPATGRGAVPALDVEAPDYSAKGLVVSPLVVLSGEAPPAAASDPWAAFAIGSERLAARAGNVLAQSESLKLLVLVHNAAVDPATSKASLKASFTVLQDARVIAKGRDQAFETPGAVPTVGPIALAPFTPGRYLARVEITDEVGKTAVVRETPFEVVATAAK
jgi:GWxTD domain-containing protein